MQDINGGDGAYTTAAAPTTLLSQIQQYVPWAQQSDADYFASQGGFDAWATADNGVHGAPIPVKAAVQSPVPAQTAVTANPADPYAATYGIDSTAFHKAVDPLLAGGNFWTSPEGQNGTLGLPLTGGKTLNVSGADSGVTYHPAGQPIDSLVDKELVQTSVNPEAYYEVNTDMSQILGQPDSNQHAIIKYHDVNGQMVPMGTPSTWQWQGENAGLINGLKMGAGTIASLLLPGYINPMLANMGATGQILDAGTGALTGMGAATVSGNDPLKGLGLGGLAGTVSSFFPSDASALTDSATQGPLSRTALDMTTDTAGAASNALDIAKFNNAISSGLSTADAVNYAADVNSTPTDLHLANNTQVTSADAPVVQGPLSRTALDMTTDTAGAASNALDVAKFNNAIDAGLSTADAVNYAADVNSTPTDLRLANGPQTTPVGPLTETTPIDEVNPTDQRLANGTQTIPGEVPDVITPEELNPTDQRLADGTQTTPPVTTDPSIFDKIKNPFVNADGTYNLANILAAVGTGVGLVGKVTSPTKTVTSLSDLLKQLPNGGPVPGTTTGGASGGFGPGLAAANTGVAYHAPAATTAPIVSGVSTGASTRGPLTNIWNPAVSTGGGGGYSTPVLDSLYGNMQRQFNIPAPVFNFQTTNKYAEGGEVGGALTQAAPFAGFVQGEGGGQSDVIDASLSPGEYVFDAESVAMLGDGNNAEGARKLDELRQQLRAQKRSASNDQIPSPAQGPLSYIGAQNG